MARRLISMAIEDIGLADPRAARASVACNADSTFSGHPGGRPGTGAGGPLFAVAPKSDAAYQALNRANALVESTRAEPVPFISAMPPPRLMKELGYSRDMNTRIRRRMLSRR